MALTTTTTTIDTSISYTISITQAVNNHMDGSNLHHTSASHQIANPLIDFIHWTFVFIITPSISVLGIVGNTFSLIILAKHGFNKSSNILLFSLAISDILYMVGVNGPPKPMYEWGPGGWEYPEVTARTLYILYHIFDSLNWGSGPTSLCIPALITIERLVAVFLPLQFPSIITPRRTVIAVLIPNMLFYGMQIYMRTWFKFSYVFDHTRNATVGFAIRTDLYYTQRHISKDFEIVLNSLIGLIIFVAIGCVAIGVKVRLATLKRLKMTNSGKEQQSTKGDASTSRTTKMLLCLCVFYTIACSPIGLSTMIPDIMIFPVFLEEPNFRSVGVFAYHVYKFMFAVNASINFVFYIGMCKHFRETFIGLFRKK